MGGKNRGSNRLLFGLSVLSLSWLGKLRELLLELRHLAEDATLLLRGVLRLRCLLLRH